MKLVNAERKRRGVPALKYNKEMEANGDTINLSWYKTGYVSSIKYNGKSCDSVFWSASPLSYFTPEYWFNKFMNEGKNYNYSTGSGAAGNNFLFLLWKATTDMSLSVYTDNTGYSYLSFGFYPKHTGANTDNIFPVKS